MKIFGSWSELVSLIFRKDSQAITLQPNSSTTYTASRTVELPAGDAAAELVGTVATQTLTNKTISGASNTLSNVNLTSQVTGTLPIANGGTGQTTANAALNALIPDQTGNAGRVLGTDGTDTEWIAAPTPVLDNGNIFVGNASDIAASVTMSGDITINNTGVAAIASGVIVNADINASAAIDGSKISPDFGSQAVVTTGTLGCGALTAAAISGTTITSTGRVTAANGGDGALKIERTGTFPAIAFLTPANTVSDGSGQDRLILQSSSSGSPGTNQFAFNLSTAAFGIGTATPGGKVHVYSASSSQTASTSANDVIIESNGSAGVSLLCGPDGTGRIAFGDIGDQLVGRIDYGFTANAMTFGTNGVANRLQIASDGVVYIANLAGSTADVQAGASGVLTRASDSKLKKDITPWNPTLEQVLRLQPVSYRWKQESDDAPLSYGFDARATSSVLPEATPLDVETDTYGFNTRAVVGALVNAVKEQQTLIQQLTSRIADLEAAE